MTPQTLPEALIHGFAIRTRNQNEMNPDSSRIIPLWQRFSSDLAPRLKSGSQVYGVYCHFESDETGAFDVIAGSDQPGLAEQPGLTAVRLHPGPYLAFPVTEALPGGIMSTWQQIWQYFAQPDCRWQRAFRTDVEHYLSADQLIIYISVQQVD